MRFFEKFFGDMDISAATGEAHVTCPFPHKNSDGTYYYESNSSAHISTSKSTFHCKVPHCQSKKHAGPKGGLSEAGFMAALQGISYGEATQIVATMEGHSEETDSWHIWQEKLKNNDVIEVYLQMIGLDNEKLIEELKLGYRGRGIVFPVFIFGEYMGACDYNPMPNDGEIKASLDKGMGQAVFPFDLWREDDRDTYLCAGFKDAAMARLQGLNACTFTHGEGSFPKMYKHSFKGRKVYICYDNDEGGRTGARRTATLLKEVGAYPIIVDLSTVCAGPGEDIHDFFYKYEKTPKELEELAATFPLFTEEEYEDERNRIYPLVSLQESTSGKTVGQVLSSRISVVADHSQTFRVPDVVKFIAPKDGSQSMESGEERLWTLDESNLQDILKLMDSGLKEAEIYRNLKILAHLDPKESCRIQELSWVSVHKSIVVDDMESEILDEHTMSETYSPLEMTMYSLGDENKMKNGEKYRIFYKAVNHPLKAREIVGVTTRIETSDTSINTFKASEEVLKTLECFQVQEGETVESKMNEIFERSKSFLGPEANAPVFFTAELFYHTPLNFMFDEKRIERAYLEPMIVGESRTHKSATAKGLLQMYELGTFVSLKNATVAGLIGGSQGSSSTGFKTRLGVIPRNHKGAVVLEEFSGAHPQFIKSMTDIRSSNMVKIERVSGTVAAPAKVRMLTLSNAKTASDGSTLPLNQYPSGVKILLDLIGAAEDVARYDFFVIKDEGKMIDPDTPIKMDGFEKESYMNRIRWIWSRKPEQVKLSDQTRKYIIQCANELNKHYATHIQFFGREAWKKLSRVSIAVAACVCSYDETGENLKISEEHVTWARNWLARCYDNKVFKMKRYVEEERAYTLCDRNDVQMLQGIYNRNATLISQMDLGTEFSQMQLRSISGLDNDEYSKVINRLAEGRFIKWAGEKVQPSPKFRTAMQHVDKITKMKRV